eukprot:12400579-Alexandrium_andersonii.AAC.1
MPVLRLPPTSSRPEAARQGLPDQPQGDWARGSGHAPTGHRVEADGAGPHGKTRPPFSAKGG